MKCNICPRGCNVDREKAIGVCGSRTQIKLAKSCVLQWEEPVISGGHGSGAIFFSGCNLKCCFCQNYEISHQNWGKEVSIDRFIEIIKELEAKKVNNINLVSPTQWTSQIIEAFSLYKPSVPIVWNSNGYELSDVLERIAKFVDVFLVDCKFRDSALSLKFCKAQDYPEKNQHAIETMLRLKPNIVLKDGIIQSGVIVRHLIMPNCVRDSLAVLDYLDGLKRIYQFYLSIMSQYVPMYKAGDFAEISRKITPLEYKIVLKKATELGFDGFMQDLSSADSCYIPKFDLEGI
ncbi:MAG: radical SAM protein [Clostridia bacterium]|nr:radical SAM protein [Clostridia bacterium]